MSTMIETLTSLHFVSTWFMLGVIWFVQVVHYPLFRQVGELHFVAYEQSHQARTTWVVMPVMLAEMGSGILLLVLAPELRSNPWFYRAFTLLIVIWASTFFIQVPYHRKLSQKFDMFIHEKLVQTNWIRTLAWSARAGLLAWV